jgi:hypothetical protein
MLAMTLSRQFGHGAMSLPSHAANGVVEVTLIVM